MAIKDYQISSVLASPVSDDGLPGYQRIPHCVVRYGKPVSQRRTLQIERLFSLEDVVTRSPRFLTIELVYLFLPFERQFRPLQFMVRIFGTLPVHRPVFTICANPY
jgi:hypothetical protein